MPKLKDILALAAAALLAAPAGALEYRFLDQAALRYFTDADLAMMEQAVAAALAEAADGETRTWENPATGNSGRVTPLESYTRGELPCRRTRVLNQAARAVDTGQGSLLDFCRIDGVWKIAEVPPTPAGN